MARQDPITVAKEKKIANSSWLPYYLEHLKNNKANRWLLLTTWSTDAELVLGSSLLALLHLAFNILPSINQAV